MTSVANEADTTFHSQAYGTQLPLEAYVQAQAEIAELPWMTPDEPNLADWHRLVPRGSMILQGLSEGPNAIATNAGNVAGRV